MATTYKPIVALEAIAAAIAAIDGAPHIERSAVNLRPQTSPTVFINFAGMTRQQGDTWSMAIELAILTTSQNEQLDEEVLKCICEIDAALDLDATRIAAGGRIDRPSWEPVFAVRPGASAGSAVGAGGVVSVLIQSPLLTS